jgi:anti-anti-sigma regulatory factor/HAMP domain-containing protein
MNMPLLPPLRRRWHPSLRLQLMLASGLLCTILAGVLALALIGLVRLRTETQQAIAVAGAKSQIANEVAIATLLCRRYEKDVFLNLDVPTTRATYLTQWKAAYQTLQQTIDHYATLASTDEERQQVELWRRESRTYQGAVLNTEHAIAVGQITTPQAANAALTPFKDSIRTLTESAREWAQRDSVILQQTNTRLTTISDQFFQLLVGMGLVALLFALGWSILFPIRLLRPIHSLQRVTQRLAQGELTARADLGSADELGALADSFNQMAQRIHQQIAELDQSAVVREQNEQLRALLDLVRDLEIPAIPLLNGVLLVPLVGHLDTRRVDLLQERVVEAVYTQHTQTVILDLTGVAVIDTKVAHAIEQFVAAVQLLGARTIVTGINAHVSQTVTHLGVRFERVQIAARVQEAIAAVLQQNQPAHEARF